MNINHLIPGSLKGKISFSEDIPGPAFVDTKLGEFDVTTLTDEKIEQLKLSKFPYIVKAKEKVKAPDAKEAAQGE